MFKFKAKRLVAPLLLFFYACGTGVGNPVKDPIIGDADFQALISQYNQFNIDSTGGIDCGSFDNANTETSIDQGRQCIRDSFAACKPAKYLLDKVYSDSDRFTSFVRVEKNQQGRCDIVVHTVSTHSESFYGIYASSCDAIESDEVIEFACHNYSKPASLNSPYTGIANKGRIE